MAFTLFITAGMVSESQACQILDMNNTTGCIAELEIHWTCGINNPPVISGVTSAIAGTGPVNSGVPCECEITNITLSNGGNYPLKDGQQEWISLEQPGGGFCNVQYFWQKGVIIPPADQLDIF